MRRLSLLALAALLVAVPAVAAEKKAPPKKTEPEAAKPADSTAQPMKGDWTGGPVSTKEGGFSFCKVENRFEKGHLLIIARNQAGEINLGLGIPGAALPKDSQWKVTVAVDDKVKRERGASAPQGDLLVIPQAKDDELYAAMMAGNVLRIQSDNDTVAFQLKGTKKLLTDLKTCAETAGKDNKLPPPPPPPPPPYPEALTAILSAAGFRELTPVTFNGIPPEQRPADYAWRIGPVMGGVREREVISDTNLEELSSGYAEQLKGKCQGTSAVTMGTDEVLDGVTIRTASVDCDAPDRKIHVALMFYLTQAKLFTVFFHEGADGDRELTDKARDNLTNVIRALAKPPAAAGPANGGKAEPAKPAAPAPAPAKAN